MEANNAGRAFGPEWFEVLITYEDLTNETADGTQTFTILEQKTGKSLLVVDAHLDVLVPFDVSGDATNDSLLADVGDDDPDRLIDGIQIAAGGSGAVTLAGCTAAAKSALISHANGVVLTLTPKSGDNLAAHDSGEMIVRVAAFYR